MKTTLIKAAWVLGGVALGTFAKGWLTGVQAKNNNTASIAS